MKKAVVLLLSSLAFSGVAMAQEEPDNRSAWAKSQDMYVEPTLRVTETTIPVTPEQAAQGNLATRQVPVGSVSGQSRTTVIGPDGNAIQQDVQPTNQVSPMPAPTVEPAAPQGYGAPVQDLSRQIQ